MNKLNSKTLADAPARMRPRTLREPQDPYECWCMPCIECIYYQVEAHKCGHPECQPELSQLL